MTTKFAFLITLAACSAHHAPAAPDAALDATTLPDVPSDAAPAKRKLALIIGQSNAEGMAKVTELTDSTMLAFADPYPQVQYAAQVGTNTNPPAVLTYPVGDLGPRNGFDGIGHFGIELTLGRDLDAAQPGQWALAKFAYGSTALAGEWAPNSTWPTGQPNLFTQQVAFVKQVLADTGAEIGAIIWIQGESDAPTVALGNRYALELAEFIGAERWQLNAPTVPFIYGRLNALNPQVGVAGVRTGEEANQDAPYEVMLDQDPYPLRPDLYHYTAQGYLDLGHAYAAAVLAVAH